MKPRTPEQVAEVKAARERMEKLAAEIEGLACKLPLDELCAVMEAGRTIRAAAHGYTKQFVKTPEAA